MKMQRERERSKTQKKGIRKRKIIYQTNAPYTKTLSVEMCGDNYDNGDKEKTKRRCK